MEKQKERVIEEENYKETEVEIGKLQNSMNINQKRTTKICFLIMIV